MEQEEPESLAKRFKASESHGDDQKELAKGLSTAESEPQVPSDQQNARTSLVKALGIPLVRTQN